MFIRPGLFSFGSKDRRPSATCSTENPSASVAEVTARTFSTLTLLNPAKRHRHIDHLDDRKWVGAGV